MAPIDRVAAANAARAFAFTAFAAAFALAAAGIQAEEVFRYRARVDLEPVYAPEAGVPYPLDEATAHRRALEQSSAVFAARIYGWDFEYELGDSVRGIAERFTTTARGSIAFGDPKLSATDAETEGSDLFVWTEYRPDAMQLRRVEAWKSIESSSAQGTGAAPLSAGKRAWMEGLEDAARAAVRSRLHLLEKNKPKEVRGAIALADYPRFRVDEGRRLVEARFRVVIRETVPYTYY